MAVDLKSLLPGFVSGVAGVREILDAISSETAALERAAGDEHRQFAASTATRRLGDWERELALVGRPDLPEDERRRLIITALNFFTPCTPAVLTSVFAKMTDGQASYSETPSEYIIDLETYTAGRIIADLSGIYAAISKIAPAHIHCRLNASGELEAEKAPFNALHATVMLEIFTEGNDL